MPWRRKSATIHNLALACVTLAATAPALAEERAVTMVVEIPSGGAIKYEIDATTGRLTVDRFIEMPVAYPANYGSILETSGSDGDALDALVLTRMPVEPGATIRVRPIGLLRMIDDGEADDKVIAVPAAGIDASYDAIRDIADLPAAERERISAFFRVYKQLPAGADRTKLGRFEGAVAAQAAIASATAAYRPAVRQ